MLNYAKLYVLCDAKLSGDCFSKNWSVWKNGSIRFIKSDGPVLADRAFLVLCSSSPRCCDSLIMYNTYHLFTHIIIAPPRCIHIGGALLDFLEKCAKWHLWAKFEFHSICTYLGGANSICMDSKCLLNIFCKL
jgi:hypothetical protein